MFRNISIVTLFCLIAVVLLENCGLSRGDEVPITTDSREARKYYIEGRELQEKLRQQEALEYFENAVAEDSQFALAHLAVAFASPSAKEFFDNLNRARSLTDHVSEGERLLILSAEAAANGDPARQGHLLNKLVTLYPNDKRVHNLLGNYFYGLQKYDSAIHEYERALEIDPDYSAPYNMLGYSYRFQGNYEAAEKSLRRYMELIPDDPNPYDSYADLLMKMGRYEESIDSYEKALEVSSGTFTASYLGIATDLNFLGRHAEARERLKQMLHGSFDTGQRRAALFATAVSYADEGLLDSALIPLREMLRIARELDDPASMSGDMANIGVVLLHAGRPEEAKDVFAESIEIIKESDLFTRIKENSKLDYLGFQGMVALWEGRLDEAEAISREYLEKVEPLKNPFRTRNGHLLAGMVAMEQGDYQRAVDHLEKADQQQAYTLYHLARAYEGLGDLAHARELYQQAADFDQLNSLLYAFIRTKALKKASELASSPS